MMTLILRKAIVMAIGLTALIGAAMPATAQTSYMRVNIPFAFVAGTSSLPAGEYNMQVDARARVLQIQPVAGNATYLVLLLAGTGSRGDGKAEAGILRFQKVGGQYYLGAVWRPEHDFGNKLLVPKSVERARSNSGAISNVEDTVR